MLDLSGENLSTYMLRELKNLVNRNPRFRNMGGDVTIHTNAMLGWGDLRITIDDIQSQGTRMSMDYFLCNQYGRSVLCKLENYDGLFIEWVQDLKDITAPDAGVYYFNVDSVNEATREVQLTIQKYRWQSTSSTFAVGSRVYFAPTINVDLVTPVDSSVLFRQDGSNLSILSFNSSFLQLMEGASLLTPMVDFWYKRTQVVDAPSATTQGVQDIPLPIQEFISFSVTDQDGYTLVEGRDYNVVADGSIIRTSEWTPDGAILTFTFEVKVDPSLELAAHPENCLTIGGVSVGEALASGQTSLYNSSGNKYSASDFVEIDGQLWLKDVLQLGDRFFWEVRVDEGQSTVIAKKMATNRDLVPGLSIAIGDQVFVGDQCAILVSPSNSETYEVYGAKEGVSFAIEVKANDRLTASEIAETIRGYLLVGGRDTMETAGISIFEVSKSSRTDSRDSSGTAPSTTYVLEVSAAADWEIHVPLVTRISQFSIDTSSEKAAIDFPGKLQAAPRLTAFGASQFLPYYS